MNRLTRATVAAFVPCFLVLTSMLALERKASAEQMLYTGLVVTDVNVGGTFLHNASLKITFEGDTKEIVQVTAPSWCGGSSYFYISNGKARMEIEYHGHAYTARLADGQIFVSLDTCNGGIGFGSFTGPNGLEPAYPLGFTQGTAEYLAITDGRSILARPLSATGDAWSCIGYPPLGYPPDGGPPYDTPPAPNGECNAPDWYPVPQSDGQISYVSYPLSSDIGDIYVYQPYYEGTSGIASNHFGSTNRGAFLIRRKAD